MFADLIDKTMDVYVDNILVKSLRTVDHINDPMNAFKFFRKVRMRSDLLKYTFGVASDKYLGYIVNPRGIEANPEKFMALIEMRPPQKSKEVQRLNGRIIALGRFISKATNKSLSFFKILKLGKKFQWTSECEEAFQALKKHLG